MNPGGLVAVPTYDKFIEPILRYLASRPKGAMARDAHDAAANALHLTDQERQELLLSGTQLVYKNRAGWAHDRLKRAGLSFSPRRGYWQLKPKGIEFASAHALPLSPSDVEQLAVGFMDVKLREPDDHSLVAQSSPRFSSSVTASPYDRLEEARLELRTSVVDELLEALQAASPSFFEALMLDVLHKMGYGTNRADLQRVGGSGDGGIDGVISLDKLGLEKVYVQAKRWQKTVGRPEVQAFYGALRGQQAKKGVFVTTSTYTPQAVEYARSVEGVVLVDGKLLTELMMDYEVGVTSRVIRVPKIDSDYFDEAST